jgi:TPR repeat protein
METQSIEQVGLVYCSAAAEQGDADADAQTSLGIMYDNRDGVAEDNAEAVR